MLDMKKVSLSIAAFALSGCGFNEGLEIADMKGTVLLPEEALTRTFYHPDNTEETLTDPRLIGPVYLGLYPSVTQGVQLYPHPEVGPVINEGVPGDTYPYGGTSIGDIRFPCMEALKCRVVSGRYVDFDAMASWFADVLDDPIVDSNGDEVTDGDYIAETCMELLHYTTPDEIRLTATDKNEDEVINLQDLDFVDQGDGFWAAEFTLWQQEYFQNEETGQGFTLWGWMDAPSEVAGLEPAFKFNTCDPTEGYQEDSYNNDFYGGRPYEDLLNFPSAYIQAGDWISSEPYVYSSQDDENVTITLDFLSEVN